MIRTLLQSPNRTLPLRACSMLAAGTLLLGSCSPGGSVVATSGVESVEIAADPKSAIEFGAVPDFTMLDQRGRTITRDDLLGSPWIMAAIFSRCTGPCPAISERMAELQRQLEGTGVMLVSISVDPDYDSSAVLSHYAESWGADPERWLFLTAEEAVAHRLVREGFHMAVDRADGDEVPASLAVTHDTRLVAVDARGVRRGWYNQDDPAQVGRLLARMRFLASETSE